MRLKFRRIPCWGFALLAVCLPINEVSTLADEPREDDLSQFYGFDGLEIFKLARRSGSMLAADFNTDGLLDLILADNSHSRIDLLQQRNTRPGADETPKSTDVNNIENDWRFEHIKIGVDRAVSAMTRGDFNGDGRTDIAYIGLPDRVIVRFQPESGDWNERVMFRLAKLTSSAWSIVAGDLNGDKKDDLVALGETHTYVFYQNAEGKLEAPERLMNTSSKLALVQIVDLNGDSRDDLCYMASDEAERGLCARMQDEEGVIGPELRFDLNRPRGVSFFNIDGLPGEEVLTIDGRTGRVKVSQLRPPEEKAGELAGSLIQFGIGSGKDRDLAVGDVNGDGLSDVVVTDPTAAEILIYRQRSDRSLDSGNAFPGMLDTRHIRLADFDGDGADEVVMLSEEEKTLAVSRFVDGRLSFPEALETAPGAEPGAVDVADLDGDGIPEVIYVARTRQGRSSTYSLNALTTSGSGWSAFEFQLDDEKTGTAIELDLRSSPGRITHLDANGDGHLDLLMFYDVDRAPVLLTGSEGGQLQAVETTSGFQLGTTSAGAVTRSRDDRAAVLVAQGKFARSLKLVHGKWRVIDQYNASESEANIEGAAELDLDGEAGNEIVLVDTGVKQLRILRSDGNVFRPWREVELGTFDFRSTHVADLNGDKRDDLLLFGDGRFAVLFAGRTDPVLKEIASFETKIERAFFQDLVGGDLNGDGRSDIAVMDTRSKYIEILSWQPDAGLHHAMQFKVFEQKSFRRERGATVEPREAVIADVTGDGRSDLILLAHDRVLLYPQDAAEAGKPAVTANDSSLGRP